LEQGDALTLPADADSVPSFSSVVETRTASGQRHLGRAIFEGGPETGDTVAGHYRVLSVLGEGGMGRVYACENGRTGKRVALKWVPAVQAGGADAIARFSREARVAGHVDHPNVIDVYDVVEEGPATFLVMELLEGESLAELLERTPKLPVKVAVDIVTEAMRGIAAAHSAGVLHRDLKPDNLFLCEGKGVRVKVVDFGVSKRIGAEPEMALTQTGAVVGTPYYMAPEQMRGMRDLDQRLDIYALGAILYEMLAGVQPYRADTLGALAIKVATEDPAPLSGYRTDLPAGLEDVIAHAMARKREDRFPDVQSFAASLEAFGSLAFASDRPASYSGSVRLALDSSDGLAAPPGDDSLPSPQVIAAEPSNRRGPALAIAVLALALIGAVAWLASRPIAAPVTDAQTPPHHSPSEDVTPPDEETTTGDDVRADDSPLAVDDPALSAVETLAAEQADAGALAPDPASDLAEPTMASVRRPRRRPTAMAEDSTPPPDQVMVATPGEMQATPMTRVQHRAGDLGLDDF